MASPHSTFWHVTVGSSSTHGPQEVPEQVIGGLIPGHWSGQVSGLPQLSLIGPHSWLATAYITLLGSAYLSPTEALPPARAAADRALQIDPDLPEAVTSCERTVFGLDDEAG